MHSLPASVNPVEALLALETSKRQALQTIGLLAFSISEEESVDYELVDWGLWSLSEKTIELCSKLSEEQALEAINRLSHELIQDNELE